MNAVGRMCPPPRSLALEANARFMVRVQVDPAEYKVAARDLRPWRAPLGSLSIDPESGPGLGKAGAVLAAVNTAARRLAVAFGQC
jgi:hypothetical protein